MKIAKKTQVTRGKLKNGGAGGNCWGEPVLGTAKRIWGDREGHLPWEQEGVERRGNLTFLKIRNWPSVPNVYNKEGGGGPKGVKKNWRV